MSSASGNVMFDRLYLKNIPVDVTKNQLKEIFFEELDNVDIHFPKSNTTKPSDYKIAFLQFATSNEGKMARQIINSKMWQKVRASFANKTQACSKLELETKMCSFCDSPNSEYACVNCSTQYNTTFYCSEDHQQRDWARHKYECKRLPKLKRVSELCSVSSSDDETTNEPFVPINTINCSMEPGSKFFITHVASSRVIYVLPKESAEDYRNMLKDIKNSKSNLVALQKVPKINEYVLAPFDNEFHRAQVIELFSNDSDGNNTRVSYIDYGNDAKLNWSSLRQLNTKPRCNNTYIFKVELEGVPIDTNSKKSLNYLQSICDKNEEIEFIKGTFIAPSNVRATFKHSETGELINEFISCSETVFYNKKLCPIIEPATNVTLGIVDTTQLMKNNLLTCMPIELLQDYKNMTRDIQDYCAKLPDVNSYNPSSNELCLFEYNSNWERAICRTNLVGNNVVLVDVMRDLTIEHPSFRRIPNVFANQLFSTLCYVEISDSNKKKLIYSDRAIFDASCDTITILKYVE